MTSVSKGPGLRKKTKPQLPSSACHHTNYWGLSHTSSHPAGLSLAPTTLEKAMGLSLSSCSQQFHPIQWLLKILSLSCSGGYQLWDLNFLTPSHILINMVCLFLEWCVIDRPLCVHWWCSNLGLRQPTTFTVLEPQSRIVSGSFLWVLRQSLKKFVGILGWFACFLTSLSGIQTLQCHGDTTQMCCASFVLLWFSLQTTSNMALFFVSFFLFLFSSVWFKSILQNASVVSPTSRMPVSVFCQGAAATGHLREREGNKTAKATGLSEAVPPGSLIIGPLVQSERHTHLGIDWMLERKVSSCRACIERGKELTKKLMRPNKLFFG